MTRDSLLQSDEKEFLMKYDTIIPSIWTPNKAYGNNYPITSLPTMFRNATVWTNENEGIIENTDVAINDGKIITIGENLIESEVFPKVKIPAQIIDASGKHLTCGIIDEHSHIAISRGVNEGSQAVTA